MMHSWEKSVYSSPAAGLVTKKKKQKSLSFPSFLFLQAPPPAPPHTYPSLPFRGRGGGEEGGCRCCDVSLFTWHDTRLPPCTFRRRTGRGRRARSPSIEKTKKSVCLLPRLKVPKKSHILRANSAAEGRTDGGKRKVDPFCPAVSFSNLIT